MRGGTGRGPFVRARHSLILPFLFQWKVGCIKEKCLYLGWVGLDQNKVVLRLYVLTYLVQRYMRGCVSDKQLRSLSDFERACLGFLLAQAHLNFFSLDRVWTISILKVNLPTSEYNLIFQLLID